MNAGDLRYTLTIQSPTRVPDGRGGFTNNFTSPIVVATVRGHVQALKTLERQLVQQEKALLTHRVTIRFRSGINSTMRMLYHPSLGDTRYLYVTGTPYDPDGMRQWLVVECEERRE